MKGIDDTMRLTIGRKRRQVTIIEVADMAVEVERKWIKNLYLRVSTPVIEVLLSRICKANSSILSLVYGNNGACGLPNSLFAHLE